MLPQTIAADTQFVVEALAAYTLDEAFAFAIFLDHDKTQFRVNASLAIPIAAGGTDFHFGGDDYFFLIHGELAAGFVCGQSVYLSNGSFKEIIPSLAIISV